MLKDILQPIGEIIYEILDIIFEFEEEQQMNKELEEAINYLKLIRKNHDLEKKGYVYTEEAIETVLQALENSISKEVIKAIELLKLYRDGLIERTQIEIRMKNWGQKTVRYTNIKELEKEELLQHNIIDWFIGSSITDGGIVINVEEQ